MDASPREAALALNCKLQTEVLERKEVELTLTTGLAALNDHFNDLRSRMHNVETRMELLELQE